MKTKYLILPLLVAVLSLVSCAQTDFEAMPLTELTDAERWTANYSVEDLIHDFSQGESEYPVRPNSGDQDLFRVNTIPKDGTPIIISGRVVSSDIEGNVYKSLFIQDVTSAMGLKISINVSSSAAVFPVGQLIHIRCNGLVLGKYGDLFQLGTLYYNNHSDIPKRGYEPGRIPYPILKNHIQLDGLPDKSKLVITDMTISEIKSSDMSVHSKLVRIKDANFTGYGEINFNRALLKENEKFFGRPKPSVTGVPISREIEDATGTINIATSEYAKFATSPLPDPSVKGDIVLLVGWYRDNARYAGSWQMTLNSLSDLGTGFDAYLESINYKR